MWLLKHSLRSIQTSVILWQRPPKPCKLLILTKRIAVSANKIGSKKNLEGGYGRRNWLRSRILTDECQDYQFNTREYFSKQQEINIGKGIRKINSTCLGKTWTFVTKAVIGGVTKQSLKKRAKNCLLSQYHWEAQVIRPLPSQAAGGMHFKSGVLRRSEKWKARSRSESLVRLPSPQAFPRLSGDCGTREHPRQARSAREGWWKRALPPLSLLINSNVPPWSRATGYKAGSEGLWGQARSKIAPVWHFKILTWLRGLQFF